MTPLDILFMGGAGEVGLNATLYQRDREAVLVDYGAFLGTTQASLQRLNPPLDPLRRAGRTLLGVVLTHGHEDHIGALAPLLREIPVPVFGPSFAIELVRRKLSEQGVASPDLRTVDPGRPFRLGSFGVELIQVTHSIPDSAMVLLETPEHRVLHTGDFKLDPQPVGPDTDVDRLKSLGDGRLDLLLSDSTNAERGGRTLPETQVVEAIAREVEGRDGRVVVSLFASHVHRMSALADVARRTGRRILLAGFSMQRSWEIGEALGYIPPSTSLLTTPEGAATLPRRQLLVLATGTQAEPGGAMARFGRGAGVCAIEPGDAILWSARAIPGRELAIRELMNKLIARGADIVTPRSNPRIHASGHAQAEEHTELLDWVRPHNFIPFHGDRVMMEAHALTALEWGLDPERILIPEDGQQVRLADGVVRRTGEEDVTPIPIDQSNRPLGWDRVWTRERMARNGAVALRIPLDSSGVPRALPAVISLGIDIPRDELDRLSKSVRRRLDAERLIDLDAMREVAVDCVRQVLGVRRRDLPWVEVDFDRAD